MSEDDNKPVFDTDQQYLGNVYGKALMGLATKAGVVDQMVDQLDSFVDVLGQLPSLRHALESPRIGFAEKESLIDKAIRDKASPEFLNFVKVVCRKGRADCFAAIRDAVQLMHDEMSNRIQATMITAIPVNDGLRQQVAEQMSQVLGKQVTMATQVDPTIIGGLVVRIGDTVYDGSVTNQLNQIRTTAIGRANQQIRQALDRFASEA